MVYVLDMPARAATGASLIIVGVTALTGAFGHTRSGNVRWNAGLVFGVVGIAASFLGTDLNQRVDPNVLLLCFAALMIVAATAMLRRASRTAAPAPEPDDDMVVGTTAGTPRSATSTLTRPPSARQRSKVTPQVAVKVIGAGLVVALDFSMPPAAAIIGSLVGKQVADKASGTTLSRAFAGLLIALATYVAIRSLMGLV